MVRVDLVGWNCSVDELRVRSVNSAHPRTRGRFLALYLMVSEGLCASEVARRLGRDQDTLLSWVHGFNEGGPDALVYRRTGGRRPFLMTSAGSSSSRRSRVPSRMNTGSRVDLEEALPMA
jgi:transposase-like protein